MRVELAVVLREAVAARETAARDPRQVGAAHARASAISGAQAGR
jgi:hypothetical protein